MKLIPLNNYVFIEAETETETASGIVLTEERTVGSLGTIYAIGENEWQLEGGDRVIYSKYTAEDFELDDIKLKCVTLDSIYALVKE